MITLIYLKLNATPKDSTIIIPSLEDAIRKAELENNFVFSQRDNDKNTPEYKIYFEVEPLLKEFESHSFFELHLDQGNQVQFYVYGGIKTCFSINNADKEIKKVVEKMKEYI